MQLKSKKYLNHKLLKNIYFCFALVYFKKFKIRDCQLKEYVFIFYIMKNKQKKK